VGVDGSIKFAHFRDVLRKYDLKYYTWEEYFLYQYYVGYIIRRCVSEEEKESMLLHFHLLEVGDVTILCDSFTHIYLLFSPCFIYKIP
jgi:hypothetical protein